MRKIFTLMTFLVMSFRIGSCEFIIDKNIPSEDYAYTSFSVTEEALYLDVIGEVMPFIPNNEYYVQEYNIPFEYITIRGVLLLTYNNTQEEFDAYRELYSNYEGGTYTDEFGSTSYYYVPNEGTHVIKMSYYEENGKYVFILDVYREVKGGTAGNGTGIPYDELFTNEGVGLPSDADGIYDIDFTKGEYIKDVTNQGLYIDGCPPIGSPAVLVIPVQFSDVTAESRGFTIDNIVQAFSKDGKTDYYSLYDYYYISSYGKLTLDVTVLDFWFTPQYESEYYADFSFEYEGEEVIGGYHLVLNEALDYLDDIMDLSQFDSDNNGTIDSVVLVNTLEIDSSNYFNWGYREFNIYMDETGSYYEYDDVHAKDFVWVAYQFLHGRYDDKGIMFFDNVSGMNTDTFIHEFGHVIGLDDYYDYAGIYYPLYGRDVMDGGCGDHNAYSKFNLGWITTSRLVVTDESITLTLEDFSKNGDTIIIANNWDDKLGAYQEYYVLVYYTNNGLNAGKNSGYFDTEGIIVYHVNAAMYMKEDEEYYDVYNRNTDAVHELGTKDNLIGFVFTTRGDFVYGVGDSMPTVIDDYGNELIYNFTVDALTSEYATITFTAQQTK